MHHPHTIHLNHTCKKTGAYLTVCFGCGTVFPYSGEICNSSGCYETFKNKVAAYNGDEQSQPEMPPLEPPASEDGNVVEMPADSKANFDLE